MKNNIHRAVKFRQAVPDSRAHPAADPVTIYSAAQHLPHRESNPRACSISALEIEGNQVSGNPLFTLPIHCLKVSVLQQPRTPGKPLRSFCALLGHGVRRGQSR